MRQEWMEQHVLNSGNEHLENGNKIKIPFIITLRRGVKELYRENM